MEKKWKKSFALKGRTIQEGREGPGPWPGQAPGWMAAAAGLEFPSGRVGYHAEVLCFFIPPLLLDISVLDLFCCYKYICYDWVTFIRPGILCFSCREFLLTLCISVFPRGSWMPPAPRTPAASEAEAAAGAGPMLGSSVSSDLHLMPLLPRCFLEDSVRGCFWGTCITESLQRQMIENVHELKTAKNKTKWYEQPKYSRVKWSMGN